MIFRFDGIQDFWLIKGQLAALNVFEAKEEPLTLGIIGNSFGEDFDIVSNSTDGYKKGLFEPAILGWNHVSYANLSAREQASTLVNASDLIAETFGNKSNVFLPPYGQFNGDTLAALTQSGIGIISSPTDNASQVYIAKKGVPKTSVNNSGIYNLPPTIEFNQTVEKIVFEVNKAITKQGYGVVVLRPTQFVQSTSNPTVNNAELSELSRLVDIFKADNRNIASFEEAVRFQ